MPIPGSTQASSSDRTRRTPLILTVLGPILAACITLYSGLWLVAVRWQPAAPSVEIGFDSGDYLEAEHAMVISTVRSHSPAEAAGLRPGDQIVAIYGMPPIDSDYSRRVWLQHKPGDAVQLTIRRPGQPGTLSLTAVFRSTKITADRSSAAQSFASQFRGLYPLPFVVVGLAVLFLRLGDRNAWLLALLCAAFTAIPDQGAIAIMVA